MQKLRKLLFLIALSAFTIVFTSRASLALSIDFIGAYGGLISYLGGATPLTGTNAPISAFWSSPLGLSSFTFIQGGALSFTTGNYLGSGPGGVFTSQFGGGGSFSIIGGVSAFGIGSGSTLMQATFASPSFKYLGLGVGKLSGGLAINYVNPTLLTAFGLPILGSGSGTLTQFNIFINPSSQPFGPGVGFTAHPAGVFIASTLTVPPLTVPAPGSLLLLGSGLTVLALIGMKRSRSKKTNRTDQPPSSLLSKLGYKRSM